MRRALAVLIAPVLGFVAFAGRHLSVSYDEASESPLIVAYGRAAESVNLVELGLLFGCGLALGIVYGGNRSIGRRARAGEIVVAAAAVTPLFVLSLVDLNLGLSPHNLLPIEWLIYAGYGGLVWLGVAATRYLFSRTASIEANTDG